MGLLDGTKFSLDGLKLSSNASKEWSGTKSDLKKKKEKIEKTIKYLMNRHIKSDKEEASNGINYSERKKQIEKLKVKAEKIEKWLSENEGRQGKRGKEIQSNITDNQSAKMKTSHGVIQGYNCQALVDSKHQIIVHAEAFGNGQDEEGREIYSERIKIIEPVFANLRIQKGMDYLTLRGKVKVNIQWLLYCIVHNIGKIGGYGMGYG